MDRIIKHYTELEDIPVRNEKGEIITRITKEEQRCSCRICVNGIGEYKIIEETRKGKEEYWLCKKCYEEISKK